jgi:hypothetical protein
MKPTNKSEPRLAYCVALLYRALEVTTSGYYAWVKRPLTIRQREKMSWNLEIPFSPLNI